MLTADANTVLIHKKIFVFLPALQGHRYKRVALLMLLMLPGIINFAQADTSLPSVDGFHNHFTDSLQKTGAAEAERRMSRFEEDKIATLQEDLIDNIKRTSQAAVTYIKTGVDTIGMAKELAKIAYWYKLTGDGVFTNTGTSHTYRNLTTSYNICRELLRMTENRKAALDNYHKTLVGFRNKIDSLNSDSILYILAADSAAAVQYIQRLTSVTNALKPADSIFQQALANVAVLQADINLEAERLAAGIEQIEIYLKEIAGETFKREFVNLGQPTAFVRPFSEILYFSKIKAQLALYFYIVNNTGQLILLGVLMVISAIFLTNLKQKRKVQGLLTKDFSGQLVLRYPVLSAILLVLNLFQFIFEAPPFIFNAIIWTASAIILTIIFRGFITKYWMTVWLTMFAMFLLACADNLVLQASRTERWCMLVMAIAGSIAGTIIVWKGRRQELKEKWIVYFIGFVAVMELAAATGNFYGRYNFSKTLLTSGFFSIVIAILFLWTVRLINEGLSLASQAYQVPDKKLFYINFERVGNRVPALFYVLLVIGWFILFARNFYSFRLITQPIRDFIVRERTVGDFSFTLQSLLVFFLILVLSAFASRVVSFFASDKYNYHDNLSGRNKVGSWLLLIRIAIISTGVLFAFAAAGIPMDRFTIIVGALSVGIGFGLQTLVNNLVSGLIISFEQPVNVGDIVDINGQSGTVKSIGFRSSVISTWEGADVIIPNGDLLSQHLVNWTMNKSTRRIDIMVGVAYGTDLEKTKQLLKELLSKDERILTFPLPAVVAKAFNNSAIDMQLLFWVRNIREWVAVKSDTITAIDKLFKENGIVIPFPQTDLHIYPVNKKPGEAHNT